jgi:hypothetical protein
MANPYLLLVALLGAIGLFATGVSVGYKYEKNAHDAALAATQDTAIKAANVAATAEIERTVAAAKTEADARVRAGIIRNKGELDAIKKSRPECSRDVQSLGLLSDAIDNANGKESTATVVPDGVRSGLKASGWFGARSTSLGIPDSGTDGTVPETAR